jgi:RNA recognition motif-containing protein
MLQPSATLYVKNIDWKIKKPLLKRALYSLFTRHGKVLEIVILRRDGLRGQAWVIMDNVQAATAAIQGENGFTFFGKDLVIEYSREPSDLIAKRDGTYVPKAKRQKKLKQETATAAVAAADSTEDTEKEESMNNGEEESVAVPVDPSQATDDSQQEAAVTQPPSPPPLVDLGVPSKYLLAQNLPLECNEMVLAMLFRQYAGYKEVRMPRSGLAFIEFEQEPHATLALQALNGFQLSQKDNLQLTYGKS